MVMRMFKMGFLVICILIIVGVATAATAYLVVMYSSSPKQYSDVSKIPYNRVGLALGTNPLVTSGNMNYYFKYRIDACERLYKAGKVSKILVSSKGATSSLNFSPSKILLSTIVCAKLCNEAMLRL